jgi:multiple sugar transport system ATP-binding protein
MARVTLESVNKVYPNGFAAVSDLNLDIADGEFLVLVGPSGCGKSTALRMVAGLETISDGTLTIGDRVVNDIHSADRDIAMVFQNYALYPHMTVRDNIAFALKLRKASKEEINERVQEAARILELTEYIDRKPGQLSGGQRQRVAMGRAIVRRPSVFLMDEPLSNLDAKLRVQMRAEIARIQRDLAVTTIYVTHDQVEAMTMGDRVAVMKRGVLQQVDSPQTLYDNPDNLFVAAFIGSPSMNLFAGSVVSDGGALRLQIGSQRIVLSDAVVNQRPSLRGLAGQEVVVGIRPENLHHPNDVHDGVPVERLRATVELVEALGSDQMIHATMDGRNVQTSDIEDLDDTEAELPTPEGARVLARFTPSVAVNPGDTVELCVDPSRIHVFAGDGTAVRS